MAIPGDFLWDPSKYRIDATGTANSLDTTATDWDALVAERWHELLNIGKEHLYQVVKASALTADQKQNLMKPGYYPKLTNTGGTFTIAVMADGKFPNVINHQGLERSPDGVLGIPERNQFGGETVSITDPAI